METDTTVQVPEERRRGEEDWADTEWFQEWLRLARREYQGNPHTPPEFKRAA